MSWIVFLLCAYVASIVPAGIDSRDQKCVVAIDCRRLLFFDLFWLKHMCAVLPFSMVALFSVVKATDNWVHFIHCYTL